MANSLLSNRATKKILLLGLFGFALFSVAWTASQSNHFLMDDYSTLYAVMTRSFDQLISILPQTRYNDRTIALFILKVFYEIFGSNEQALHICFVLTHLINTLLAYLCARMALKGQQRDYWAILAAGVFGIYPRSLMAVSWIAALYDLFCGTFVLLSLYFFLCYMQNRGSRGINSLFCLGFYMLSLRCKEMSLVLPVFFLCYELADRVERKQKIKASPPVLLCSGWMFFYAGVLFSLPAASGAEYAQSFNPLILLRNLFRYLNLYFSWFSGEMAFSQFSISAVILVVLACLYLLTGIVLGIKQGKYGLIPWILGIVLILSPVLTMSTMQHVLYMYIPGFFIGMSMVIATQNICHWLAAHRMFQRQAALYHGEIVTVGLLALVLCNWLPGPVNFKNFWLGQGNIDHAQIEQVRGVGSLPSDTTVYVKGAADEYNILNPYGPGHVLNLIYKNATIRTELVEEYPDNPASPYVFWIYQNGTFREIERDLSRSVSVQTISFSFSENGELILGVSCTPVYEGVVLEIDNILYPTIVGEEFISTTIPPEAVHSEMILRVIDEKWGVASEEKEISLLDTQE